MVEMFLMECEVIPGSKFIALLKIKTGIAKRIAKIVLNLPLDVRLYVILENTIFLEF